ncbi:MAG TPA: hypothetical protein VFA62_12345 [Acidimicrobiia bacterium]|nr:hypothetical protein [Acidimicrobiia bacterium]
MRRSGTQLTAGIALSEEGHEFSHPRIVETGKGAVDRGLDLGFPTARVPHEARADRVGLVVPPANRPAT